LFDRHPPKINQVIKLDIKKSELLNRERLMPRLKELSIDEIIESLENEGIWKKF